MYKVNRLLEAPVDRSTGVKKKVIPRGKHNRKKRTPLYSAGVPPIPRGKPKGVHNRKKEHRCTALVGHSFHEENQTKVLQNYTPLYRGGGPPNPRGKPNTFCGAFPAVLLTGD